MLNRLAADRYWPINSGGHALLTLNLETDKKVSMSKVIAGREGPVLGIESSVDMFEKLKYESARLQKGWHSYDAFNFLVTAWHLFADWPNSDDSRALSRMKRHRPRLPEAMNLVLDAVRDLVNGSKHFYLDPGAADKRRVDEVHTGEEVGFYEYFFHEDLPAVTVDKHWYFSIRVLNNLAACRTYHP